MQEKTASEAELIDSTLINDKVDFEVKMQLEKIAKNFTPRIQGSNWEGTIIPNSELVKGFKGRYYLIDLTNAETNELIKFDIGKYVIDDFDKAFQEALADFGEEVIETIDKGYIDYRIFIKGSADILGDSNFTSKPDDIYKYNNVSFFPKYKGKSSFISEQIDIEIPTTIKNKHLPILRAKFIKEKLINTFFQLPEPVLLESGVTIKIDENDRNAMIFLFLPQKLFGI